MKRKWFQLILSLFIFGNIEASPYTGHVYVDGNGNQQYDKGEKVLPKVSVSDGLNVVQTDKDGRFELPGYAGARFIFMTRLLEQ